MEALPSMTFLVPFPVCASAKPEAARNFAVAKALGLERIFAACSVS